MHPINTSFYLPPPPTPRDSLVMRRSSGYTGSSYYREPTEEEKIHLVKEKFAKGRIDYSQLEQEIDDILNPPKKKGFLK